MADYGTIKVNKVTYKNGSDADTDFNFKTDIVGSSSPDFTTDITLKNSAPVKFEDNHSNEYTVGIKAPAAVTASYTLTLPAAVGASGKVLKTSDGAGALEWGDDTALTLLDEDNFGGGAGSATAAASQQSIKAFADTTYQPKDADTAKTDVDQTWTGAQRGTVTNIGSVSSGALNIDLSASNNHKVASSGTPVFTFTNFGANGESLGQSGTITVTHTGSGVPTWNGHCNFAGGLSSAPTITADATTILAYYVYEATDNTTGKVLVEGLSAVAAS